MSYAIEASAVVAGFINTNKDGMQFDVDDVYDYIRYALWNAGVGPIRHNFTRSEMISYLNACDGVCLRTTGCGYIIDKTLLNSNFKSDKEREFLLNNPELARSFDLFCRLQVDIRTPRYVLDKMGYRFLYA